MTRLLSVIMICAALWSAKGWAREGAASGMTFTYYTDRSSWGT